MQFGPSLLVRGKISSICKHVRIIMRIGLEGCSAGYSTTDCQVHIILHTQKVKGLRKLKMSKYKMIETKCNDY